MRSLDIHWTLDFIGQGIEARSIEASSSIQFSSHLWPSTKLLFHHFNGERFSIVSKRLMVEVLGD